MSNRKDTMKKTILFLSLIFSFAALSQETELCKTLKQTFMDSKRFHKTKCRVDKQCELTDLKWKPCSGMIAINKEFAKGGVKHFSDLRDKTFAACHMKKPICERRQDQAICYNETCSSLNSLFEKNNGFKVYFKFEGLSIPPSEIVLRREHIVYCITAPCPPLTTDKKIKLTEGILFVKPNLVPYGEITGDIQFFFIYKGYERVSQLS